MSGYDVPRLPSEPTRGDGETWESYARRLEKIIARQRHELSELAALRREAGNRLSRKKIERLYVALGAMTARWEQERSAKLALIAKLARAAEGGRFMTETTVGLTANLTLTLEPLDSETLEDAVADELRQARVTLERVLSTTNLTLVDVTADAPRSAPVFGAGSETFNAVALARVRNHGKAELAMRARNQDLTQRGLK